MRLRSCIPISALALAACLFGEGAEAQTAPRASPPSACLTLPVTTRGHASVLASGAESGQYQITPNAEDQLGALWGTAKADLTQPFDYSAWVYLGRGSDTTQPHGGGDGMTFTLHNDSRGSAAIGLKGRGLGASRDETAATTQITPSLIVEFDTYGNADWGDLTDNDHVAIYLNGDSRHVLTDAFQPKYFGRDFFKDARYHLFRATWTPSGANGVLTVYFDNQRIYDFPLTNYATHFGASEVFWGFTASTSGAYNSQRVCNVAAPISLSADYGDAPASYGKAAHFQNSPSSPTHHMGSGLTVEAAPHSSANADGDADDGASFSRTQTSRGLFGGGASTRVTVRATGSGGRLRGWIDWDGDGSFGSHELVADDVADGGPLDLDVRPGYVAFDVRAPVGLSLNSFLRLRWSPTEGVGPSEPVVNGEAEDYAIRIEQPVEKPLACPAGYRLQESVLNGGPIATPSMLVPSLYNWSSWSVPGGWQPANPGFHLTLDTVSGGSTTASQSNIAGLGLGPSTRGGGVLTAEVRWLNGNPATTSPYSSRLAVALNGQDHITVDTAPYGQTYGEIRYPGTAPNIVDPIAEGSSGVWRKLRVDLSPIAGLGTLSVRYQPPASGSQNDDFIIRNLSIQTCVPAGDVKLEMRASTLTPRQEEAMEFELIAHNEGLLPVTDLVIRNTLQTVHHPTNATIRQSYVLLDHSATQGTLAYSVPHTDNFLTWTVGDIPPGESRMLRLVVAPVGATAPNWTYAAEAWSHSHVDADSSPGSSNPAVRVKTEDDYAELTPVPLAVPALPPLVTPNCSLGQTPRQVVRNHDFSTLSGGLWPEWTALAPGAGVGAGTEGWRQDGSRLGAYISTNNLNGGTLQQTGLPDLTFGPSANGTALLHLDLWWRNGAPSTSSSGTVLILTMGGTEYMRMTTPDGPGGLATLTYSNGATGSLPRIYERVMTSLPIHLPLSAVAAGEATFHHRPIATNQTDDVTVRRVAVFVCDGVMTLTPNHESTVPPGQLAIYPHRLTVTRELAGGALSFATTSDKWLGWVVHKDDGDGVFNAATDAVWTAGAAVAAGTHDFWLVARTPHGTPAGWRDLTRLRATVLKGGRSVFREVDDLTRVGGALEGWIHAVKSVAPDAACDGTPDSAFVTEIPVHAGTCAIYRISFENRGVEMVRNLRIYDHTPDWTTYRGGSAQIPRTPPGLHTPVLPSLTEGETGSVLFSFGGELQPGRDGIVEFGVRLLGRAPSGGGGGGPAN